MSAEVIRQYLTTLSRLPWCKRERVVRYGSYAELILDLGQECKVAPRPEDVEQGTPKECFKNAFWLARDRPELTYVEGYGLSIIPVEHAWCVDYDGNVVDPTWPDDLDFTSPDRPGTWKKRAYFGVPLEIEKVSAIIVETGYYGVFGNDYLRDHKILIEGL